MRVVFLVLLALCALQPRPLSAQKLSERLHKGDRVLVVPPEARGERLTPARVESVRSNRLTVRLEQTDELHTLRLERNDLIGFERLRTERQRRMYGGMWGAFLGASLGGIAAPFVMREISPGMGAGQAVGTGVVIGAAVGVAVGMPLAPRFVPDREWDYFRYDPAWDGR